MLEVNWPSPGFNSPPGCSKAGSRKWTLELMLMKNGWVAREAGPPFAPPSSSSPAWRSRICAVKSFVSKRSRVIAVEDFGCAGSRRRFPPVKHHRAQKRKVGGRQRAAVHRNDIGCVASIPIVDTNDLVVCISGNSDSDADQASGQQQAVGLAPLFQSGDIRRRAVRAVHGAEDGVGALRGLEALANV